MLTLPEYGFQRSVKQHNCNLTVVCDWIEISLLIDEPEISRQTVNDILVEQGVYDKGDADAGMMRATFLNRIWDELRRRARLAGQAAHYIVQSHRLLRLAHSSQLLPAMFLLCLSCSDYYDVLRAAPHVDYVEQGDLFEEFCRVSLAAQGWTVERTGWASATGAKKLRATVESVMTATGEDAIQEKWVAIYKDKNEAGCDLVSFLGYPDGWIGRPLVLLQCASGADYGSKLGTPDLNLWRKLIAFSVAPQRGFCTPRAFEHEPFLAAAGQVDGWLMERHRLLRPFATGSTELPRPLARNLAKWVRPRFKALPRLR